MKASYTFRLGRPVTTGLVSHGKFDGEKPSLVCGTNGGRVLVHLPHEESNENSIGEVSQSVRMLNLNRNITALAVGSFSSDKTSSSSPSDSISKNHDLLFVGTQSSLLAYDVERNADTFFTDVADGVNTLTVGTIEQNGTPLVLAGGNCSVLGFDSTGNEAFWTVTGDNVSSLMTTSIMSPKGSYTPGLLVGSDDYELRLFAREEVIAEVTETDRPILLTSLPLNPPLAGGVSSEGKESIGSGFAYGLANGTVGVYADHRTRLWRVKTKHTPTALVTADIDGDGEWELVSGWKNGGLSVRRMENGTVVHRENLGSGIASLVRTDYRLTGKDETVVVTENGEIRGFLPTEAEFGTLFDQGVDPRIAEQQESLLDALALKSQCEEELRKLKTRLATKTRKPESHNEVSVHNSDMVGALPAGTEIRLRVSPNLESKCIQLRVEASVDSHIVNVVIIDSDGAILTDGDVLAITPRTPGQSVVISLRPAKHQATTLRVQTHLAPRSHSTHLHVFESEISVPCFSSFLHISEDSTGRPSRNVPTPDGYVTFSVREDVENLACWLLNNFIMPEKLTISPSFCSASFLSVCELSSSSTEKDPSSLIITFTRDDKSSSKRNSIVKIATESLELASEIVSELAKHFSWDDILSTAYFPEEFTNLQTVLDTVAECNTLRISLMADMAEESQRIKALVIRAEDSRLQSDMSTMTRAYTETHSANHALLSVHEARASNQAALLAALKSVNLFIQRAASLRVGRRKQRIITAARAAIKANDLQVLVPILQTGDDQILSSY